MPYCAHISQLHLLHRFELAIPSTNFVRPAYAARERNSERELRARNEYSYDLTKIVINANGCVECGLCRALINAGGLLTNFEVHYDSRKCRSIAEGNGKRIKAESATTAHFRSFFTVALRASAPTPPAPLYPTSPILPSQYPTRHSGTRPASPSPPSSPAHLPKGLSSSLPPLSPATGPPSSLPPSSPVSSIIVLQSPGRAQGGDRLVGNGEVDSVAQHGVPDPLAIRLIDELEHAIQGLPTSIPEAAPGDDVYRFAEWGIDVPEPELAWMCLNKALDGLVGYDHDVQAVSKIVCRGQWGFMHVVGVIRHFATTYPEVIEGVLLEPKIRRMIDAMATLGVRLSPEPRFANATHLATQADMRSDDTRHPSPEIQVISVQRSHKGEGAQSEGAHITRTEIEVVGAPHKGREQGRECVGFRLDILRGRSVLASYPVLLHEHLKPPWSLNFVDGCLYL
ncbi:hypothetical protein K488DRAFT_92633 [Vararia minispora EC-137]|uniref:Uncharacterized protein n=1 Tax=Vararia minispora EC-137 TaxID=1314806 RepID=A0ACB8Q3V7_9AGAM|nr:hypothetical protein K488DRAFT_92633 [Vararia minispora EC-137]